jgi:hypothetical protein
MTNYIFECDECAMISVKKPIQCICGSRKFHKVILKNDEEF